MKGIYNITEFDNFHQMANGAVRTRHEDIHIFEFTEIGQQASGHTPLFKTNFYQIGLFREVNFEVSYFGEKEIVNRKNAVVLFKPGQAVRFRSDPSAEGYAIMFKEHFIDWRLNNFNTLKDFPILNPSFNCVLFVDEESVNELLDIAKKMQEEYRRPLNGSSLLIIRLYCQILIEKINSMQRKLSLLQKESVPYKTVEDFKKLVYENIHKTKRVTDYAAMLYVSEKTLMNHFRISAESSPKEFINSVIIAESKALLRNKATVEQVADYFNFTDQAHFSNFFRKKTGQSPNRFKNQ